MIKQKMFYYAECDNCGDMYSCDGDMEFTVYETKDLLIDALECCDWTSKDEYIYCEECSNI